MDEKEMEARNAMLEEQKERNRLLKADIDQTHDQNISDWIRSLKSAERVVKKAFNGKRVISDEQLVAIASQMVIVISNRRIAQKASQARQDMEEKARAGRMIRPS